MTQYNTSDVKQSKSQLNKLKSGIKNAIEVILKISSNVVGDSNDENYFPYKLLLTNTSFSRICKAFANSKGVSLSLIFGCDNPTYNFNQAHC